MKPKSNAFLATSLVLCLSALTATAATFLWDGGGADDKFTTIENWNPDGPVTVAGNDIRFGASPQTTADVNVGGNFSTLFFNADAPAMTISASANPMQFATGATTQIQNNSSNPQTFSTVVRAFWITGSTIRVWDSASGDLNYQQILLRPDSSVGTNLTLNFAGSANQTVNDSINLEGSWTGKTANIAKSGSGTLTLLGGGNYNGSTSANGGNLVLDLANAKNILSTSALSMGSGTFTLKGASTGSSAQTVASIVGSGGKIVVNPNGGDGTTLTVTSASVPAGATINIDTSAGASGTAVVAWNPVLTNGIIGGGITVTDDTGTGFGTVTGGLVSRVDNTLLTATNPTDAGMDFLTNSNVNNTVVDAQLARLLVDTSAGPAAWNLGTGNSATLNLGVISMSGGGDYVISNGTLKSATPTNSDLALVNAGPGTFTIASPITNGQGASTLTKTGPGTVVLSGANTYTGITAANGGTLILSGSNTNSSLRFNAGASPVVRLITPGAAGTGLINFTSGASNSRLELHIDGGGTVAVPNALGGNTGVTASIDVDNNGDGSTGGVIQLTGSSGISAIGAMTFNVTGSNGYSLKIDNLRSTAGGGGAVNFNPTSASLTLGNLTGSVGGKTSTWTLLGTDLNSAVTGVISNGNATAVSTVQKSHSGTWTLSGANTYTGNSQVLNGILNVGSLNRVVGGTASSNLGAPVTAATGTIDLGSATATGVLNYTGAGETTDRVINLGGTTGGGEIRQSGTGALVFSSAVTATGGGAKTLTLSGSTAGTGEISGSIPNSSGSTTTTAAFAIGATSIPVASATGAVVGASISGTGIASGTTIAAITGLNVTLSTAATAAGSSGQAITISGAAVASLTKSDSGTWTLSGANSYTGAIKANGGTLNLTGNRTTGVSSIAVGNPPATTATLNISNGSFGTGTFFVGQGNDVTGVGVVNQTGGTLTAGGNQILIGNGSGATPGSASKGIYNLSAGTLKTINSTLGLVVGTNNGTTAVFNLSGTGFLSMTSGSTLQITRSDGSAATNVTGTFNQTGGTATVGILSMGGSTSNSANNAGGSATLNLTGGMFSAVGFAQLSGGNGSSSSIVIGGSAQVTLPAFPTGRGAGATATVTFDGGTLSPAAASAAYLGGLDHAYLTANGAKINVPTGNDITISQDLENAASQTGTLTKQGAGTLTLTGSTAYTGATIVEDGVLSVASGNFSNTATLTIGKVAASPAVLNLPNAGTDSVASLVIDGVAQASGTYDSSNSGGAITGDGKILVGAAPASYASWAAAFTSPPLSNTAANADPDFDGIPNSVEYVTGGDPRVSSQAGRPTSSLSGSDLLFQFSRVDSSETPDVSLVVETSTNLADWASQPSFVIGANNAGSSAGVNIVENGSAADAITVTISGGAKKFARLRVITTP